MTLAEVAGETGLARPTARRILRTLVALGYVRADDGSFALTPRVLELGMTYVQSLGLWDVARPHMEALVRRTGESSSIAQLDGSDIVYVARVAVPKIITLRVRIGTRFPAAATSLGKVLLAGLAPAELDAVLAEPSRAGRAGAVAAGPGRARRRAARGPRQGLGPHRRAAGPRGSARSQRPCVTTRARYRRDERHGARGRDERRDPHRHLPPVAPARGRRRQRGLRPPPPCPWRTSSARPPRPESLPARPGG